MANFTARKSVAPSGQRANQKSGLKPEPKIIHQTFFKSVGPRTYAAQIKEIANGNQLLVLTEGKRDDKTNEVRKTRLFVYGEDFPELFKMLEAARSFIEANPVSKAVQIKRQKHWEKTNQNAKADAKINAEVAMDNEEPEDDLDQ